MSGKCSKISKRIKMLEAINTDEEHGTFSPDKSFVIEREITGDYSTEEIPMPKMFGNLVVGNPESYDDYPDEEGYRCHKG
ncbi:MAG: hypothetical protein OQK82_06425 [Candidatus Pacearchaeota archaeon]|nr:hypothetical protein [Candidatus Pacearchaeota archaeon]